MIKEGEINHAADVPHILFKILETLTTSFKELDLMKKDNKNNLGFYLNYCQHGKFSEHTKICQVTIGKGWHPEGSRQAGEVGLCEPHEVQH